MTEPRRNDVKKARTRPATLSGVFGRKLTSGGSGASGGPIPQYPSSDVENEVEAVQDFCPGALIAAATTGDVEQVQRLLQEDEQGLMVDIDEEDDDGRTALHWAARNGHALIVRKLCAKGADMRKVGNYGYTALHLASSQGRVEAVAELCAAGADVDFASKTLYGWTPLYIAARNGHLRTIKTLCQYSVDVNKASINGTTPLHAAAEMGFVEILEFLIQHGADPYLKNYRGVGPLDAVVYHANQEMNMEKANVYAHTSLVPQFPQSERVLRSYGVERSDSQDSSLIEAAKAGDVRLVKRALEFGNCLDDVDDDDRTALYWAAQRNHEAVVRVLVEAGANVNICNSKGWTALHRAAASGHAPIVKMLIEGGANVLLRGEDRLTALDMAKGRNRTTTVLMLQAAEQFFRDRQEDVIRLQVHRTDEGLAEWSEVAVKRHLHGGLSFERARTTLAEHFHLDKDLISGIQMVLPGGMIRQMSEDDWEKIKPGTEIIVEVESRHQSLTPRKRRSLLDILKGGGSSSSGGGGGGGGSSGGEKAEKGAMFASLAAEGPR